MKHMNVRTVNIRLVGVIHALLVWWHLSCVIHSMRKLYINELCILMPSPCVYSLIHERMPFVCIGGFVQPILADRVCFSTLKKFLNTDD